MNITLYVSDDEMKRALETLGLYITSDVDSVTIYSKLEETEATNG